MADPTDPLHSSQEIIEHAPRSKPFELATGDEGTIDAVTQWAEEHLGPVSSVFHELVSDLVHIDVHIIPPNDRRPCLTLVTSGMSERPMTVPQDADGDGPSPYAELMISLRPDWHIDEEALKQESNYWPIRWLKTLARMPHEYDTWLGFGHTIPSGNPAQPYAPDTKLCCMLVLPPVDLPEEAWSTTAPDGRRIDFLSLHPLYDEEMELKLRKGTSALLRRMHRARISPYVDPARRNAAKRRLWPF